MSFTQKPIGCQTVHSLLAQVLKAHGILDDSLTSSMFTTREILWLADRNYPERETDTDKLRNYQCHYTQWFHFTSDKAPIIFPRDGLFLVSRPFDLLDTRVGHTTRGQPATL